MERIRSLSKHGKRFDIVAGTSIDAINAAIITSSIADDDPRRTSIVQGARRSYNPTRKLSPLPSTWHDVNHTYGAQLIMHRVDTRAINH